MVSLDIDKHKYQYFCVMLRYKEREHGMDEFFLSGGIDNISSIYRFPLK